MCRECVGSSPGIRSVQYVQGVCRVLTRGKCLLCAGRVWGPHQGFLVFSMRMEGVGSSPGVWSVQYVQGVCGALTRDKECAVCSGRVWGPHQG